MPQVKKSPPNKIDDFVEIEAVARVLERDVLKYAMEWFPGGKIEGNEYVTLNYTRGDKNLGSFKINFRTKPFVWSDFAQTASGGDGVSLFAYKEGISQGGGRPTE